MIFHIKNPIVAKKNSHRIGVTRDGRRYSYRMSHAAESEEAIKWELSIQAREQKVKVSRDGEYRVQASFKKTRADCIGLLETVLDALEGVVYENDRQVAWFSGEWGIPNEDDLHGIIIIDKITT